MKFNVSGDLIVPFLIEVEASSAEMAEKIVEDYQRDYLLAHANTEDSAIGVSVDYAEPAEGRNP